MNIREIEELSIPVTNLSVSLRFYHEVFDLPIIDTADGAKIARLGKQVLRFMVVEHNEEPLHFSVEAKDSISALESHLANYGVEIKQPTINHKIMGRAAHSIVIADYDDNIITINTYRQKD